MYFIFENKYYNEYCNLTFEIVIKYVREIT